MNGEQEIINTEEKTNLASPESKSFDTRNNTLLLRVGKKSLNLESVRTHAEQNNFDEKSEFHITILGFKNGAEIKKYLRKLSSEEQQAKLAAIQALIAGTDWSFIPEKRIYHITKEYKTPNPQTKTVNVSETREAYIQMVRLPALKGFFTRLNNMLGINLESPPTHVTLYTNGTNKERAKAGIGINSETELAQLNPKLINS